MAAGSPYSGFTRAVGNFSLYLPEQPDPSPRDERCRNTEHVLIGP
jgi:hypothetical protein